MDPRELAALPPEVRRLIHAVGRYRDKYADAGPARRDELWTRMHEACDAEWGRRLTWRDHLAYAAARLVWRIRRAIRRPNMR